MGIEPPTPSFERSFITALTGDRTNTSGQVINLNMNTAFKCVSHIPGNLKTVAELCADAHYEFPLGKQSFQYMSGETHTYTLSHQGRTKKVFFSILLTHKESHREAYRDFQPSLTSSAGGAKGCSDHRFRACLLYTSPSPRDRTRSRMPSSA